MRTGLAWGSAVVAALWSGLALAQVPGATAPPPAAPPEAAPAPDTTQAAPTPAPPPAPAPVPAPAAPAGDVDEGEDDEEEAEAAPTHGRYRPSDDEESEEGDDDAEAEPPAEPSGWRLGGPHFVLSVDRVSSILAWSETAKVELPGSFAGQTTTVEVEDSGTSVALLSAGVGHNAFAIPRVSLDGMFSGGFTLGGSLGYMVSTGGSKATSSAPGSSERTAKLPTLSMLVVAPRLGVFLPASPSVAIWLRGGITHVALNIEEEEFDSFDNVTRTIETTTTLLDVSFDPQLVLSPAPHVAILLGVSLDIGASGTTETKSGSLTDERDVTASSYGVTAGLAALF